MGKELQINCGKAIMIDEKSKALEGYSAVRVNSGSILISRAIHEKLGNVGGMLNAGSIHLIDEVGVVARVGENAVIDGQISYSGKFIVSLGIIHLTKDAANAIAGATGIYAEKIYAAKSLEAQTRCKLYGTVVEYPDDAVILYDDEFEIDEETIYAFPNGALLFSEGSIKALCADSAAAAKRKGLRFECGTLIAYSSVIEANDGMFTAERVVNVPDGYAYADARPFSGGMTLDRVSLAALGKRIYVDGDLFVEENNDSKGDNTQTTVLDRIESIVVSGKAIIPIDLVERFKEIGRAKAIKPYEGKMFVINSNETLNHEFLSMSRKKGIVYTLQVNGRLKLDADVTEDDITCLQSITVNGSLVAPAALKLSLLMRIGRIAGSFMSLEDKLSYDTAEQSGIDTDIVSINTGVYVM